MVVVAVVAAWPAMSQPGLLNTRGGGDSPFLLQRLHQLTAALAGGHFPVRCMPDAAYGDGYPFYNYYAPLSIYIAAAFRGLGFSFVRAIHMAQLAGFVVAGLGAFYLGRRWLRSDWAGLLAAVAYTAAPFHMVNVYVRGDSLAEFWAMAWYPVVLLAADGLVAAERPTRRRAVALFALAYAALILSHNISALIFSPFLLLYLAVRLLPARRRTADAAPSPLPTLGRAAVPPLAALALAFALAAFFFVPALAEQDLAQLGPVTEGYFHYSNHFRGLDLVGRGLLFDYNPDGGVAFRLGLAQALGALAGAAVLLGRRPARRAPVVLFAAAAFVVALVMITPLSRPLWDHLPLLPFTQFPWRFLSVAALFGALLTGGLATLPGRGAGPALAGVVGLVLLLAALLGLRTDHLILTDADVTAERLAQYEWFTGNIGTTVSAEYLPPAAVPRPWTSAWLNEGARDRAVAVAGEIGAATLRARAATRQEWDITAGPAGATVVFPTLAWPGWGASSDGQPADATAQPGSGRLTVAVPPGSHTVTLALTRTPLRLAAELLSLAAVIITAILLFAPPRPRSPAPQHSSSLTLREGGHQEGRHAGLPLPFAAGALVLLTAAAALLWRNDPRDLPAGDLTWDFAQMAYLHHDRGGVAFEDGTRLYEYGYSAEEMAAGATLIVTLSVAPGDGGAATLALVTPAEARPPAEGAPTPPVVAAATLPLDTAAPVFRLNIPADAPPGLYVPRLTLDGARPLLPSGGTRGELFLRPVRVESGIRNDELGIRNEDGGLDVRAMGLTMRDATTLDGHYAWYTARPLGARYQFSLRLQDAAGGTLAQLDAQPGYGFQPSTLWPAGEWTADWLALRLPAAAPAAGEYPLVMRLYDAGSGQTVLTRRVGVGEWANGAWSARLHEPSFALPPDLSPTSAVFGQQRPLIALPGYRLVRGDATLRLTLYWQAAFDAPGEFTRFMHLLDGAGAIVAQSDGAPAGNSYPTGQWVAGEVVSDTVTFDLSALPPGEYRLATGFYAPTEGLPRLNAATLDGPLPDGRFLLPETVTIEE